MIATKHDEGTRLLELLPRLCPPPCVFHPRCLLLFSFSAFLATYAQVHGGQHDGWLHAFFLPLAAESGLKGTAIHQRRMCEQHVCGRVCALSV